MTYAVLSNPVLRPPGDFAQGFALYDTDLPQTELGRPAFKERRADATTDRAIQVLQHRDSRKRFFLWIHYNDPHGPYAPPTARPQREPPDEPQLPVNETNSGRNGIPKYQFIWNERSGSHYRERYRQEVEFLDSQLARLFAVLDVPSISDHVLVIFTADHGESLGEHNYYFAHGEYLYPELIDVPLIVRGPGLGKGPRRDLVGLVDILPSVAAYLNVPLEVPVRGNPVFNHPAPTGRTLLAATYPAASLTERFAAVRGGEELIFSVPNSIEFLSEGKPVALDRHTPVVAAFETELRRLVDQNQLAGYPVPPRPVLTKEAAERLRSLGYVR
jgi:arylsulfatase A-like enzyme